MHQDPVVISHPSDTTGIRLVNHYFTVGNSNLNALDTFTLVFNKPVTLQSLLYAGPGCLPDLRHFARQGDSAVQFCNFLCNGIGNDYPFSFIVSDSAGRNFSDTLNFKTYYKKYNLTGEPGDYFISADNKYCWFVTNYPNQIYCVGLADTTYVQAYDLNFEPAALAFNPYNNRIYLTAHGGSLATDESVFEFDPVSGTVVKTISIPYDSLNRTERLGQRLAFGNSGVGMLTYMQYTSDDIGWLVLDPTKNDTLYVHPSLFTPGSWDFELIDLENVTTNHDGSKIIGLQPGNSTQIDVLDCNSLQFTEYANTFSFNFYSYYMRVNRVNDQIFMAGLIDTLGNPANKEFLVSGFNGITGATTYFDALTSSDADFSYRAAENNFVYYLDNNTIGVVNYNNGQIMMTTPFASNLSHMRSTTDGQYLIFTDTHSVAILQTSALEIFH